MKNGKMKTIKQINDNVDYRDVFIIDLDESCMVVPLSAEPLLTREQEDLFYGYIPDDKFYSLSDVELQNYVNLEL